MEIAPLEDILGYHFQNPEYLRLALTHRSSAIRAHEHNERLEFFGDAIVSMVICEHLFEKYPKLNEGGLTAIKSSVVARPAFARVLRALGVRTYIRRGRGVEINGDLPDSLYANIFEAIIAAIYFDSGRDYTAVHPIVLRLLADEITSAAAQPQKDNPKACLQFWAQAQGNDIIYVLVSRRGPPHRQVFTMAATFSGRTLGHGTGSSKKAAEQAAARAAVTSLGLQPPPSTV